MTKLLSNDTKFSIPINEKNETEIIEKQMIEVLKRIINDQSIFEPIKPTRSIIPRLYDLPKRQKPSLPLIPILDMFGSPYHSMEKWLADLLEPVRKCNLNMILSNSLNT
ncbi:unnamed protein product [Schistosoma spindalis]|nr:unnamed protein product [Schistosoma spindale]